MFLAAIVDRATPCAETTFPNIHFTSNKFTDMASSHNRCGSKLMTNITGIVERVHKGVFNIIFGTNYINYEEALETLVMNA